MARSEKRRRVGPHAILRSQPLWDKHTSLRKLYLQSADLNVTNAGHKFAPENSRHPEQPNWLSGQASTEECFASRREAKIIAQGETLGNPPKRIPRALEGRGETFPPIPLHQERNRLRAPQPAESNNLPLLLETRCAGQSLTGKRRSNLTAPAIEFRNVSFALPNGHLLLDHISLTLTEGTTTAILGRSGSGKTTLLRTVNRLIEPTSGEVLLAGINTRDLITLRRSIGYVIQEVGLFPHFTLERNVALVLEAQAVPLAERTRRSQALLSAVGLDPATFAHRYPRQLSGGQRQRAGLARALAADPPILLMDEPFGALDPLTRLEMQQMMRSLLQRFHKTVLLVTHDLDEALYLADRIVLLDSGRTIANLTPEEFLHSTQPEIRAYVQAFRRERTDKPYPDQLIAGPNLEARP